LDGRKTIREPLRTTAEDQRNYQYSNSAQFAAKKNPPPPKKIFEYLDRNVIGQEQAKKVLSVAVYNHYKRLSINIQSQPIKPASEPTIRNLDGFTQLSNTLNTRKYYFPFRPFSNGRVWAITIPSIFYIDLLHLGGLGHSSALGAFPQQSHTHQQVGPSWANSDTYYEGRSVRGPPTGSPPGMANGSISGAGSDILDATTHDAKLDKSNILLLGPTGSGEQRTPHRFPWDKINRKCVLLF